MTTKHNKGNKKNINKRVYVGVFNEREYIIKLNT